LEVYGVRRGYQGLLDEDIFRMESRSVANIIQRGGTFLKTARCKEFYNYEGRKKAYENLEKRGIDGLIVIGGDGSFKGATMLSQEFGLPCIGIAGTIDKDIAGTDFTIGFDTAVNTAVNAIDKIRDTADAHDRLFVVEVMGRDAGYIAVYSGISTGAGSILIPERKTDMDTVISLLQEREKKKKLVNIIVVAEGDEFGGAEQVAKVVKRRMPHIDTRVCILGHIQRGGSPSAMDRVIASRMGYHAVESLLVGRHNVFVGIQNNRMNYIPLVDVGKKKETISMQWMKLMSVLSG
jgi:6-phosphofructokinase 1